MDRLLLTPSPLPNSYRQELRLPSGCKQPWNRGVEGTVWAPAGSALVIFTHRKHSSSAWHIVNAQEVVTGVIFIINSTGRICSQWAFGELVQPWAGPWKCLPWSTRVRGESLDKGRNVMRGK